MDKKQILIVDDVPENIKVLNNLLNKEYQISFATNGPQALDLAFSDNRPDLILLDVMMPGMDGYQVIEKLQQHPKTRRIPVLFVTAKSETEDEARGLRSGQ